MKQSPNNACFDRLTHTLLRLCYKQAHTDHTMFILHAHGKISIIIKYVDDIILTGDYYLEIDRIQKCLANAFETNDVGHLRYFFGYGNCSQ